MSFQSFLDQYGPSFQSAGSKYNLDPSLIASQAYLESGGGNSYLTRQYNNLFGVTGSGDAGSIHLATAGYTNGQNFAAYSSTQASIDAYAKLLGTNSRYAGVVGQTGQAAANAVAAAGYAKDPNYASKVGSLISKFSPALAGKFGDIKSMASSAISAALHLNPATAPFAFGADLLGLGGGGSGGGLLGGMFGIGGDSWFTQFKNWITQGRFFSRIGLALVALIFIFAAFYLLGRSTPEFKAAAKAFA